MPAVALQPPTTLSAASAPVSKPASTPVAVLEHVGKRFGPVVALRDLSLVLRPGEIVALLGPNGAGKSTAVRTLLGLSRPSSGTARVFGKDPRLSGARTGIGAMLQVASVPKTLKVREHIELFRTYYPAPLSTVEVVRIAGLEGIEDRLFDALSGGQKQRLLFALAICGDPEILVLDEPTVGMDIEARRLLWAQIRALAARGKTVLLTTHYLEEADALATRIVVVDRGRILAEGTPAEIKRRTSARKIRCRTALSQAELARIPGVLTATVAGVDATLSAAEAETALRHLLAADPTLSDLQVQSPGLEDAFLALTSGSGTA